MKDIFTLTNITYLILILALLTFIILIIIINSTDVESFGNTTNNICGPGYNKIDEECIPIFSDFCGFGTIPGENGCIVDENAIGRKLIEQNYIQYINNEVVFVPGLGDNSQINIQPIPNWYENWLSYGGYDAEKVISWGICNVSENCLSPCRCADCAGWRGGNTTDCDSNDIGGGRVWCNLTPGAAFTYSGEPDKCECEYGYVAVNGLCVSPFKSDNTTPDSRCCPDCIFYSPEVGGCDGSMRCDTNNICQEANVTLPGKQIKINNNNSDKVKIVNKLCSDVSKNEPCYDPNDTDARKRQPYVLVSPSGNDTFNTLVEEVIDTAHGQNEYECAFECGTTVNTQLECSKRCLPHIWRWYPVFENLEEGTGWRYTGGYYQSDELMRYLPSDAQLLYCPQDTCETEINLPDDRVFNNCVNCDNCGFIYDQNINNNGFKDRRYLCNNCETCTLDTDTVLGEHNRIGCKDMMECSNCVKYSVNLGTQENPLYGLEYSDCDICAGSNPNNDKAGCKVFTLDPYISKRGGTTDFHPGAILYNHGADPNKNYTNKTTSIEKGYDPSSRYSGCNFPVFPGQLHCGNTLNDKVGWGDGGLGVVLGHEAVKDCTDGCTDGVFSS